MSAAVGHVVVDVGDQRLFGCRKCAPSSARAASEGLFLLKKGALNDWDSGPVVRSNGDDITNADGAFPSPQYYGRKTMVVTGWVEASTQGGLEAAKATLRGAIRGDQEASMMVDRGGVLRYMFVRLNGAIEFQDRESLRAGEWKADLTIPLVAQNPYKYGGDNTFALTSAAGSRDIWHRGNTNAYPMIYVTGATSAGYQLIRGDGAVYRVDRALAAGVPHQIDMSTGLLRIGGVVDMVPVTSASIWRVPRGANATMQIAAFGTGTANAQVVVTDTYI